MKGDDCGFLHQFDQARMPVCRFYAKYGECREPDCVFKVRDSLTLSPPSIRGAGLGPHPHRPPSIRGAGLITSPLTLRLVRPLSLSIRGAGLHGPSSPPSLPFAARD